MAVVSAPMSGAGPYTIQLEVTTSGWELRILRSGSFASSFQGSAPWSVTIFGETYSGTFSFSFPSSGDVNFLVASGARTTYGVGDVSGAVSTSTSAVGSGTAAGTITLGGVVRVRVAGAWRQAIPYARVSGAWRQVNPFGRSGGSWRQAG